MGISINLYRVSKAEKIADIKNLETEIEASTDKKVDLYKMTQDLAVIFLNSVDPFSDTDTIPYKMLFGNFTEETVGWREIGGFIPTSDVKQIAHWLTTNKVDTLEGFIKMYDNLSIDVKQELEEIASPEKEEMFQFYVKPLTDFYKAAHVDNNSVVVSGE